MAFVQFSNVSHTFGDRDILKNVNLRLASGSRSCLTGANGSGKTTLMKIIANILQPDLGERAVQKNTRISYLPQDGIVHYGKSLRDEAETAFSYIHEMLNKMEQIGALLEKAKPQETTDTSDTSDTSDSSCKTLIEEHHLLQEKIEDSGYYTREADVSLVLSGLGFSAKDVNRNTEEFSGGWQMRIALAKILLEKPDILLLDEPTNYLDIEARRWLSGWLKTFTGGYLLVSHDRHFLDVSVNEVYELFQGNIKRYAGNYTEYEKVREIELEGLVKRFYEQQAEIVKTDNLIRRFRYKASKAAFAQELIKRLEKMQRIEIPESLKKININFPPPPHSPNIALTLENIGKSYGNINVLESLDLVVQAGERLVVAGRNGAGKSTLLRIIAGVDNQYEGIVKYGNGICSGYFSQDTETMNGSEQVIEYLEKDAPFELIPKLRDMLGAFLFRGDDVYKSVCVLSGGEKSRLALLKMFLKPMNLLILDEPTNHLDLMSKEILLDALTKYKGTVIFVSHDHSFMEALSTKTLELSVLAQGSPAKARLFYGNYAYYLERLEIERIESEKEMRTAAPLSEKTVNEKRLLDKQKQTQLRRLERKESQILKDLQELEKIKFNLEKELEKSEVYSSNERAKEVKLKIDECSACIEEKNNEWENTAKQMQ